MKFSGKRALAAILCVNLLASAGVFSARAEKAQTLPVTAEVAAEDAVFTAQAEVTYVCEVDGSDYMFILMNDYKMLVYNLDTGKLVDCLSGKNLFMQPRGAVMDNNGILWVCGLGNRLFWYDVRTGESGAVTFTYNKTDNFAGISNLNLHSLALGDDGNVYFGTSTRGYFGMCDTTTKQVFCISPWLDGDPNDNRGAGDGDPDSHYAGYGGLIVRDGYIYACVEGDQNGDGLTTHFFIKYDIANKTVVDSVDVTDYINENAGQYRQVSSLGESYVMLGCNGSLNRTVLIDISGSKMALKNLPGMSVGCYGFVAEADGYAYVTGRSNSDVGIYKIDIANLTAQALPVDPFYPGLNAMLCRGSGWATINGEKVIVTYRNNTQNNTVEPVYYDVLLENSNDTYALQIQREFTVDEEGVKQGAGNQLRSLAVSADREYLYMGCYGVSRVAQYHVPSGKVTKIYNTYDEQTDSLLVYDGYLYAGNYSKCTITQVDLETGEAIPFFMLKESVFKQYRAHSLTAGDGKVFLGTVPKTGVKGGVLAWYDLAAQRTYVAAGDGADNVYYADNTANNDRAKYYEWHRLSTDEAVADVTVSGLIPNQTINGMLYKDGLIYGTTTIHGGSGSSPDAENAKLFVYDVEKSKVLATCDLATVLDGFTAQIQWIDAIAEDPLVPGMFWGVVADTLFRFTFDGTQFSVTEALCLGKDNYMGSGNVWDHRNIIFDGSYMYVTFPATGVYMVNRNDTSKYRQLSAAVPKQMEMGADGNLYFFNVEALLSSDLQVLRLAEHTQPLVALSVQEVIDALPAGMTAENKAQFDAAKDMYDALIPATKTLVDGGVFTRPYSVGDATYSDLSAAISAATQSGMPVALNQDVAAQEVLLADGVTLDLNGYTLTAEAFSANVPGGIAEGFVVDSSAGNGGLLRTERIEDIFQGNNPDLPVYDTAAGGYRFFDYQLTVHGKTEKVDAGKQKFWFKFHFYTDDTCTEQDVDAYELVYADGSNLTVSVDVAWKNSAPKQVYFGRPDGEKNSTELFSQEWAKDATLSRWLYIVVGGLDKLDNGILGVTPSITVNGVQAVGSTMTYQNITTPIPGYGWSDGIQ